MSPTVDKAMIAFSAGCEAYCMVDRMSKASAFRSIRRHEDVVAESSCGAAVGSDSAGMGCRANDVKRACVDRPGQPMYTSPDPGGGSDLHTHAERPVESGTTERDRLVTLWSGAAEPAAEPAGTALRDDLVAVTRLSDSAAVEYYRRLLEEALGLFTAERAFLFECVPDSEGGAEVARCLASLDLDGDEVDQPDRKAPRHGPRLAAATGQPFYRALGEETPAGKRGSSVVALPAICRERTLCILVVENRFQDIAVDETTVHAALVYCRALAAYRDLAAMVDENASLWTDLTRMQEEAEQRAEQEAARSGAPRPAAQARSRPQREGLQGDFSMIVGASRKIVEILEIIDRISGSNAPVLINGESGTGKELAALAVHSNSPRRDGKFVSENCGAITETLLESELFGYVKGAFTGANKEHKGLFELACGGTLFLDEVGDMSSSMQKKLLRVLQEGVIRRVGDKEFTPVDVRIISATNKDLLTECQAGNFREDLFYRLNVINLRLPPLRERGEDIPPLIEYFLTELAAEGEAPKTVDSAALQVMSRYTWPGNIRELQNEVKKLVALSDGDVIGVPDLSEHLRDEDDAGPGSRDWTQGFANMSLKEATELLEKVLIRNALDQSGGNKSLVAKSLQIPKTSLYNKIHKYQLG